MLKINPEVLSAIKENRPVVALESTIISHGMPYPKNVQTALEVERVIREHGAVPATIGIIDGDAIVGMTPEEIEQFGKRKGIIKVSRRDLPVVYAKKLWAATTVAATMIIANQAGIKLFVTGGIGGVHRGAQETNTSIPACAAIIIVDATVVAAHIFLAYITGKSLLLALAIPCLLPNSSISSGVIPTIGSPSIMPKVAGTAPQSLMTCSTRNAVSTFFG